jgi:glyoxylase-like metal-dependent hydrolase (beta-lactamase superfamily II)
VRIHHLNCGTCCPAGGRLFDGTTDSPLAHLVCHCLLIESDQGLILVDTGFGTRDVAQPGRRLSAFFRALNNPRLRAEETAVAQVRQLGFKPGDVRHIVITHLDFDHAGGIEDFPNAAIHITAREKEVADQRRGGAFVGSRRYRPMQWDEVEDWRLYPFGGGEPWFGFDCVRDLAGLPPEILLIPLAGHTWGHAGVAIDTGSDWLFYAGDAYFYRGEIGAARYECPPGMRAYQTLMEVDRAARLHNLDRVRGLSLNEGHSMRIFCAHDAKEFDILSRQPVSSPALNVLGEAVPA